MTAADVTRQAIAHERRERNAAHAAMVLATLDPRPTPDEVDSYGDAEWESVGATIGRDLSSIARRVRVAEIYRSTVEATAGLTDDEVFDV